MKTKIVGCLVLFTLGILLGDVLQNGWFKAVKHMEEFWLREKLVTPVLAYTPNLAEREEKALRADLVWDIYGLESTWGKNDGCLAKGLWNGFGFRQNSFEWVCYGSFEEVSGLVREWVDTMRGKGYTIPQLLCYYNQGRIQNDCPYYQKYLTLK